MRTRRRETTNTLIPFAGAGLILLVILACQLSPNPQAPEEARPPSHDVPGTLDALSTEKAVMQADLDRLNADIATQAAVQATQPTASCCAQVEKNEEIIAYLATRVSALAQDADLDEPAPYPTQTPYHPVTGSVRLEQGRCCAGGIAGETISVTAVLEARSPAGLVTEMRVRTGATTADEATMATAPLGALRRPKGFPGQGRH